MGGQRDERRPYKENTEIQLPIWLRSERRNWGSRFGLSARHDLGVRASEAASEGEGPGILDEPNREGGSSRAMTGRGSGLAEMHERPPIPIPVVLSGFYDGEGPGVRRIERPTDCEMTSATCGSFMIQGAGSVNIMLAATRRGKADGMNYTRQRLARVSSTSEGATGMATAPCRGMRRTMINSGVVTTSTRPPTGALRNLSRARRTT